MALTVLILLFLTTASFAQFDLQHLGKYVSVEQRIEEEVCETKYCMLDANYLFYAATQNSTVEPCDDFREFAMGTFIKFRALNDRYEFNGFDLDLLNDYWELLRKVLAAEINEEKDSRIHKVMKNHFRKCVSSDNVRQNGTSEMIEHLKSLGGSPFISGSSWNSSNYSLKKLFNEEPFHATVLLLNHELQPCLVKSDDSDKIMPCFLFQIYRDTFDRGGLNDTIDMLVKLRQSIPSSEKKKLIFEAQRAAQLRIEFYKLKQNAVYQNLEWNSPRVVRIQEMRTLFPSLDVDWLTVINNQLVEESKLSEEDSVLIEDIHQMTKLSEFLVKTDQSIIAEAFAMAFLYSFRELFIVYPHNADDQLLRGTKKSLQRWQQCLNFNMGPGLVSLYAQTYQEDIIGDAARKFTREVIDDLIVEILNDTRITGEMKTDLMHQLKSMEIITGLPNELLNLEKVEEFYKELKLSGDENLIKTGVEIYKHIQKIQNSPEYGWKRKIQIVMATKFSRYFFDYNILYLSPSILRYPMFHPDRPRFFNTANFYTSINYEIQEGLNGNLSKKLDFEFSYNNVEAGFENYVQWEAAGNKDLSLGANFLTNQQLYWLAVARKLFVKLQPNAPESINRLQSEYLHVWLKNHKGFQTAFMCEMTDAEFSSFITYVKKTYLLTPKNHRRFT